MTVAKKIGGVSISVAIFLAVRIWRETSNYNVAISLRVAISWLLPEWLFAVAISVAIFSLFLNLRGYFSVAILAWLFLDLRGYF